MIRLNAFFTVKKEVETNKVLDLAKQLVEKSLKDEGCVSYGIFQSGTDKRVMMFCETWKNQESLDKHSAAKHFTTIVPQIEALTVDGLKCERFEFPFRKWESD